MRATYAALHYGDGHRYPVHESNLPEMNIEPVVADVVKHMGTLSGGFQLDKPTFISVEIIGNGYTVRLDFTDKEELHRG